MNLNEAVSNLSNVLLVGRIDMPAGPLTAQEHQELAGNFNLLVTRAQLADKLNQQISGERKACKEPDKVPEAPEVPDETNEVEEDERTE